MNHRLKEHCAAHVGGSECIVRLLMYLLDGDFLDRLPRDWQSMNAKERERYVEERVLKPFIDGLRICAVTCGRLGDRGGKKNVRRRELEEAEAGAEPSIIKAQTNDHGRIIIVSGQLPPMRN